MYDLSFFATLIILTGELKCVSKPSKCRIKLRASKYSLTNYGNNSALEV